MREETPACGRVYYVTCSAYVVLIHQPWSSARHRFMYGDCLDAQSTQFREESRPRTSTLDHVFTSRRGTNGFQIENEVYLNREIIASDVHVSTLERSEVPLPRSLGTVLQRVH